MVVPTVPAAAEMLRSGTSCSRKSAKRAGKAKSDSSKSMSTLFLSPPSFDGFDGGAGSRYQARREITSYWYPTWLAQPAALLPDSKLLDCPPHEIEIKRCLAEAQGYDHVIIHTSPPSLTNN